MTRKRMLRFVMVAVLAFGLLTDKIAIGQVDPANILAEVISQLQTGTPNPSFYGIQLWQMISMQTAGRGIYPQLVQLGDVQDISVQNEQRLPQGVVYVMQADHENGQSVWQLGISSFTNKIEYANFNVSTSRRGRSRPPNPSPSPGPSAPAPPSGDSDACRKYPNLC